MRLVVLLFLPMKLSNKRGTSSSCPGRFLHSKSPLSMKDDAYSIMSLTVSDSSLLGHAETEAGSC